MQAVTAMYDTVMKEDVQNDAYVIACNFVEVDPCVNETAVRTLATLTQEHDTETAHTICSQRVCLRRLAKDLHLSDSLYFNYTFDSWSAYVKFSNNTSIQLQRILYFIQVQVRHASPITYNKFYTPDFLQRVSQVSLECIDASAVIAVLHGLRVYRNNIHDLIDFRMECLTGLPHSIRNELSLSQIARLYIACWQHDSIWEECWKSVVPVLNHTIITARAKFTSTHDYDVDTAIINIVDCHVYSCDITRLATGEKSSNAMAMHKKDMPQIALTSSNRPKSRAVGVLIIVKIVPAMHCKVITTPQQQSLYRA